MVKAPARDPALEDARAPRRQRELIGHAEAEGLFLDAWNAGRMPHAWLICGPRGIGKATLAYRMARFVLSQPPEGSGGGLFGGAARPTNLHTPQDHPAVMRIVSGGHADLKVVERAADKSTIAVDEVRGVGNFLSLTAGEGGWRVVIVDAADEMNRNAANAILKVLEEPPARALLLLVSHAPGRLLPTIRSRCRRLNLKPLAEKEIVTLLLRHAPEINPPEAQSLARMAEGSAGRALELADAGGLALFRDMLAVLAGLPRLDIPLLHRFAERMGKRDDADSFRLFTELLEWWLARLVRAGGRGMQGFDSILPEEESLMARLLIGPGLDRWADLWERNRQLFAKADGLMLDRKQVVLNAFLAIERLAA